MVTVSWQWALKENLSTKRIMNTGETDPGNFHMRILSTPQSLLGEKIHEMAWAIPQGVISICSEGLDEAD